MSKFFASLLTIGLISGNASALSSISNLEAIRASLRLSRFDDRIASGRTVRVAILDKGFHGVRGEIGRSLPKGTLYLPGSVAAPEEMKSNHGLRMAQIVSGLVTEEMQFPRRLELRLYNAFGFTNFRQAVRDAIAQKVDLILYSEVWEYGGNLDGRGFVNAEVNRALDAGILWINAAGNFGRTTYNGRIETGDENWVRLPDQNKALKLVCRAKRGSKCPAKIVLSWNDFKDDSEDGTDKDLDLALADDMMNVLQSSGLKQSRDRDESRPGHSKYPREIIAAELKPGTYFLRVKDSSENFGDDDRLRVTVDGDALEIPSGQPGESVLVPADNPRVLTVGASDSDRSGRSVSLNKPDIYGPSSVKLDDGDEFRGSSNSAAFTAAVVALIKLSGERLSRAVVLARSRSFDWNRGLVSLATLRFGPTQGGCFSEATLNQTPEYVREVLAAGGRLVQTTAGMRIMVPHEPTRLFPELERGHPHAMVVVTPQGAMQVQRGGPVPAGAVEVFPRPIEAGLCRRPSPSSGYNL